MTRWLMDHIIKWLITERPAEGMPLCNFSRIRTIIQPGDVVLVEGRSFSSSLIKMATHSPWSHAALSIGPLNKIHHPATRKLVEQHYDGPDHRLLIIEALMDRGVVISDLQHAYGRHHLRICRPNGISDNDKIAVLHSAASNLGLHYDFRHLIDITRHLFPYHIIPKGWGSRLYRHYKQDAHKTVCSSMLARAFMTVSFPIIPIIKRGEDGVLTLYRRNLRIMTPRDFDVSPYFEIVKYPLLNANDVSDYRNLPWNDEGMVCNADGDCFIPELEGGGAGGKISWSATRDGLGQMSGKFSNMFGSTLALLHKHNDNKGQHKPRPYDKPLKNGEA